MDLSGPVLAAFRLEHKEQLEGMRAFLAAHAEPDCELDAGLLQEAFRLAHSLKAGARVCSLRPLERLGHDLESLFDRLRGGTLEYRGGVPRAIARVLDAIEDWMEALGPEGQPPEPTEALAALRSVLEAEAEAEAACAPGAAAQAPPAPPEEAGLPGPPPEAAEGARGPAPIETLRVRADSLDALLRSANRIAAHASRQERLGEELAALEGAARKLREEWTAARRSVGGSLRGIDERPELRRVRRFLDATDAFCAGFLRRTRAARDLQEHGRRELRAIAGDLQQGVRRARLVRAGSVFQGFRRTCRELAAAHAKEVDLCMRGLEVEADRMVLEALKSPVLHLLRNAVAHGVEAPDERERAGKPRAGVVELVLRAEGSRLALSVEDDGPGVDTAAVARAAVEAGLLGAEEAAALGPDELADLAFHPHLSTAARVDDLAGRGVGLADVRDTVRRLRGSVRARRRAAGGARFELDVPLSLATHRLLVVDCGGRSFALPADTVEGLARVEASSLRPLLGQPCVVVGERSLPLHELASLVGLPCAPRAGTERRSVVLVGAAGMRAALAVDGFREHADAIVKDLRGPAGALPHLYGGVVREDGDVVFVLDPAALLRSSPACVPAGEEEPAPQGAAVRPRRVLIVDDSFTTRTLEKSLLEAHGYEVVVAVDGQEALARLRTREVDLVISDVQMPVLDGFGLLRAVRADRATASLPVIMVTSMSTEEDRRKGLELGANAYIVKQRFDHQELLDTIEDLL